MDGADNALFMMSRHWVKGTEALVGAYPEFLALGDAAGRPLPARVQTEFERYLKCGRLEHGFLRAGQKVFALQTVPAQGDAEAKQGVAQYAGFSLHAGTAVEGEQREKLERLARYVTRPPVAVERLTLTPQGHVRYRLKTAYRDGTTHVVFEPLDFLARLAALVPPPRVHLTRYHGVFAPHAALRSAITPAGRGQGGGSAGAGAERVTPKHVAMSWMQRLKRVFAIEIEQCRRCGGRLEVIASIEDPALIERIVAHVRQRSEEDLALPLGARGPPP
jgi:hypothetical protein